MKIKRELLITVVALAALLAGCGGGGGGGGGFLPPSPKKASGTWAWVSGATTTNQTGVYGTKGASTVPGAREGSVSWTDASGNLWLFGGYGYDSAGSEGNLNDLWKFDGTDWIWVRGADTVNRAGLYPADNVTCDSGADPGSRRSAVSWTDASGNLWLFGGYGLDMLNVVGRLNDLWKFDPASDCWTWVSGAKTINQTGVYGTKGAANPANVPGAREGSVSWIDASGNLWLFGGYGIDSAGTLGYLNDLWKFDGANWTWVSGANTIDQKGAYGTKGVASSSNVPGARDSSVHWTDASGNLWLFGGYGLDSANVWGYLNDLWKFDGTNWTWVSGANTVNQTGVYGTKGVPSGTNVPGARGYLVSWIDTSGNLWLFGGYGFDSAGTLDFLNDLWKFDGTNWTWVSGANTHGQAGVYGTKGVPAGTNVPGARVDLVSWIDASGNLWLFGGYGHDSTSWDRLNDLWKFNGTNWTWVSGANTIDQKGVYGTRGAANIPGARENAVSWTDASGDLWLFGGYGYDSAGTEGVLNDLWKFDSTNWTWVSGADIVNQAGVYGAKGTPDPSNVPGARYDSASWTDADGNLWLFGGTRDDAPGVRHNFNDLWKFDPASGNWTWVSGANTVDQPGAYVTHGTPDAGNVPGARGGSVSWIDASGNLWLFGGGNYFSNSWDYHNDLWKFDGADWTWVSGANSINHPGVYGTKGVAASSNVPGARGHLVSWIDSSGNLLLFGGFGVYAPGSGGMLNDLWKFDGTNWTWVSGANTHGQAGVYGTKGVASSSNVPGARYPSVSWTDASGNLWLFGGDGIGSASGGYLNDLWKFDGTNWTWVSGANTVDQAGVYGTKGVASSSNVPGTRAFSASWTDASGNLWLFGGNCRDSVGNLGRFNDLWRFTPQ